MVVFSVLQRWIRQITAWAHPYRYPLRLFLLVMLLNIPKLWLVWHVPNPNLLVPKDFSLADGWLNCDDVSIFRLLDTDHRLTTVIGWFHGDWVQGNGYYRPLAATSMWLDYLLWRHYHRGYALTSWLLQGITGWLWALLLFLLFRNAVLSVLTALAFAIIWLPPSRVIIQHLSTRADCLCAVWMLASLLCAFRFWITGQWQWLTMTSITASLALLSKEMALTLPLLSVLCAVVGRQLFSYWHRIIVTFVVFTALVIVWWWAYQHFVPIAPTRLTLIKAERILNQCSLALADTLPTVWFFGRWLLAFNHPIQLLLLESWQHIFSFIVTVLGLGLIMRKIPSLLIFWFAWVAICWLPLLPVRLMNPHYGYIPLLATYALIGGAIYGLLFATQLADFKLLKHLRYKATS